MKRLVLAFVTLFACGSLFAQSLTLTTPLTYAPATNAVVRSIHIDYAQQTAQVKIAYTTDSSGAVERAVDTFDIPADRANPGTEFTSFLTTIGSVQTGETGGVLRRANYRVIVYLCASARLSCSAQTP